MVGEKTEETHSRLDCKRPVQDVRDLINRQ